MTPNRDRPRIGSGDRERFIRIGGVYVTTVDLVSVMPLDLAVIVTVRFEVMSAAVVRKLALAAPASAVTLAGTGSVLGQLLCIEMVRPPAGARPVRRT